MEKLQLIYDTWQRPDADGLFDYQQQSNKRSGSLLIKSCGVIYRQKDEYDLVFERQYLSKENYQAILKIIEKQNRFHMQTLNIENEPLCKIVTYANPGIHEIIKSDRLKLGKVEVDVIDLSFGQKIYPSSYQQIQQEMEKAKLQSIRQITPQFYKSEGESKFLEQSLIEDNPCCRYCYSKTVTQSNNFLVSCHCKGSSRYIHENCLMEWVLKRGHLRQIKGKGIFFAESKIFKCELCHNFFYIPQVWKKIYHYQKFTLKNLTEPIFNEVLIMHFKFHSDSIYFIDLSKNKTVSIGRGLDNEIVINELSVSRQHAFILINAKDKIVALRDNNSKFGTLALLKRTEVEENGIYQVGRSKITFKKKKKKSFLQKLGIFCVIEENLNKQKKKLVFDLAPFEEV